jgi:(1->4)-alpha-D-glucan 1-alpha-D-glucosylmutase
MVHTRWNLPNTAHENALKKFVASVLKPGNNPFLRDFVPFQRSIAYRGIVNGLTQALAKIISPGIPDFYQGSELWDLRLVDPDNRQAVNFAERATVLATLKHSEPSVDLASDLAKHWEDGRIKLYAIWKALNFRRARAELFSKGDFVELKAAGPYAEHTFAILRHHKREWVLFVAPRWLSRVREGRTADREIHWGETTIQLPNAAPQIWESIFTGERITTAEDQAAALRVDLILNQFPIALLRSGKASTANPSITLKA